MFEDDGFSFSPSTVQRTANAAFAIHLSGILVVIFSDD